MERGNVMIYRRILESVSLCSFIYEDSKSSIGYRKQPPVRFIKNMVYEKGLTRYQFIETDKEVYLVFQGTESNISWRDFIDIFTYSKKSKLFSDTDTHIKVHSGFLSRYEEVKDHIHRVLKLFDLKNKTLVITGHGIGGAIAKLCAIDLQYSLRQASSCIVFGDPVIGNKHFNAFFEKRVNYYSFKNKNDFVSVTPMWWLGYAQLPTAELTVFDKATAIQKLLNVLRFANHHPKRYVSAVNIQLGR
jgi:hypothetical protein